MSLIGKICVLKANSPAIHKLGDIQRDCDDLFRVEKDFGNMWEGSIVMGFGFMGVKVAKENIRELTENEWKEKFAGKGVQISNQTAWLPHKEDFAITI